MRRSIAIVTVLFGLFAFGGLSAAQTATPATPTIKIVAPASGNPDPTLLTPGLHTVQIVLETHQHVPLAGGASQLVSFTVSASDLQVKDPSLAQTAVGMNMAGMTMTGTATLSATATAPLVPNDDGNPGFGLWLLAIVGIAALFVLGQAALRGRQTPANRSEQGLRRED